MSTAPVVYGTEDILRSLCNSVTKVLSVATNSPVSYSGMVQRISRTCLKPDIGGFVLFDGGFSGLVVINFSAAAAMELYENYMLFPVSIIGNWSDHETMMQEKFGKDLTPHRVKYRLLKR